MSNTYCTSCGLKLVEYTESYGYSEETGEMKYVSEWVCPQSDTVKWETPYHWRYLVQMINPLDWIRMFKWHTGDLGGEL